MRGATQHNRTTPVARAANDNSQAGVTTSPFPCPKPSSITVAELKMLQPVIEALAMLVANDLCATTLSSEEL
jgi:hypothetical protein